MSRDTSAFTTLNNANMTEDEFYIQIEKARERGTQSRQPEIDALKEAGAGLLDVIAALKAENERLRKAIPKTPESIISFIGSHFNGMRTGDEDGQTYTDLSKVEYWLTIHDLLSAFSWAGLGPEEIDAAMKDFSTTTKEEQGGSEET